MSEFRAPNCKVFGPTVRAMKVQFFKNVSLVGGQFAGHLRARLEPNRPSVAAYTTSTLSTSQDVLNRGVDSGDSIKGPETVCTQGPGAKAINFSATPICGLAPRRKAEVR
jgi:hypothetical protein